MSASVKEHHKRNNLCTTRPPYRQGRELKAVKVYTVSQESKFIQVHGVPKVGTEKQLVKLFQKYGIIQSWKKLKDYPCEEFTEAYLFNFEDIQCARKAKRFLDDRSFFGGVLHVHYVPEYEETQDTRLKLQQRRRDVARRIRGMEKEKKEAEGSNENDSSSASHPVKSGSETELPVEKPPDLSAPAVLQTEGRDLHTLESTGSVGETTRPLPPWELPKPPSGSHQPPVTRPPPGSYHPPPRGRGLRIPTQRSGFPQHYGVTDSGGYYPPPCPPHRPPVQAPEYTHSADPPPATQTVSGVCPLPVWPSHDLSNRPPGRQGDSARGRHVTTASQRSAHNQSATQHSATHSSVTKEDTGRRPQEVVIRQYQPEDKTKAPKFVPRPSALSKRQVLPDKLLSCVSQSVRGVSGADINPVRALRKRKQDPVNDELRANAFILRDVQGPKLPRKQEELRRDFGESLSGDPNIEGDVMEIRRQVIQFSVKAMPPQLKRAKKQ